VRIPPDKCSKINKVTKVTNEKSDWLPKYLIIINAVTKVTKVTAKITKVRDGNGNHGFGILYESPATLD